MNEPRSLHEAGRAIERAGLDRQVKTVDTFERGREEVRPQRRADADRYDRSDRNARRQRREGDERQRDRRDDRAPNPDRREARQRDERDDQKSRGEDRPQTRRRDRDEQGSRGRDEDSRQRRPGQPGDDHSPELEDDYDDREPEYGDDRPDYDEDERQDDDREDDDQRDTDDDAFDDGQGDDQPREELFTVKVHGREFEVTKDELVRGYQRQKDYQVKTAELAGKGRELTGHHQQQAQFYQHQIANTAAILEGVKTALVGDLNSPQMQQLKAADPQQWAVARQMMQERIDQVNTFFGNLIEQRKGHEAKLSEAQKHQRMATIREELGLLLQHVPDWQESSDERIPPAQVRVGQYLTKAGFAPEEFKSITDHRMLLTAWKAMEYDRLMSRRERPQREARPVPKGGKPGRSHGGQRPNTQQSRVGRENRQHRRELQRTGSMRAAGKLIESLL